ncbi:MULTISPECIES: hypothetical protein [Clostridium]|uniref:Uncharacterized protein n=1 Tax=Clostridium autoethanogenum DSM 10061 TaxID=1341692 RepID=A0ABN4BGQ1_9CLOT|nr:MULTISPECIES: hypothetical protein [Clostridium]AGY75396.2 hypothetical protein CAETHG_1171 [Clostridium autoethanogenum DSM 10061]
MYNRKFNLVPAIHEDLSNYKIEKNKLFANVVAIKYLLPYKDELDRLINDLDKAIQKWARFIDLSKKPSFYFFNCSKDDED